MIRRYDYQHYPFAPAPEQVAGRSGRYPVAVIGAGPVGLSAAIDLARHGVRAVVLDGKDRASDGSRAICFAKRSLEIFDRLGCVAPMRAKGVTWNTGRLFYRDREASHVPAA